jgi:surface protein
MTRAHWVASCFSFPLAGSHRQIARLAACLLVSLLLCAAEGRAQEQSIAAEEALLRASNAGQGDQFGHSVSLDGDRAVIGGRNAAAYVFERQADSTWLEVAVLSASNVEADDDFGRSVSIDGDRVVVGAAADDGPSNGMTNAGAAYVFERDAGGTWQEVALLRASNAEAFGLFGSSSAILGDRIVVGAFNAQGGVGAGNAGSAYIYERQSDETWQETSILTASNAGRDDEFGRSVAIADNRVVVGAPREAGPSNGEFGQGAAYVFEQQSNGTWQETSLLRVPNEGPGGFGWSSSMYVDRLIIGKLSSAAYVYDRQTDGTWEEVGVLRGSNTEAGNDGLGHSVSIAGDRAVVGARGEDGPLDQILNAGAAYVFEQQTDGTWQELNILRASNAGPHDEFGFSVSIAGDQVVVGAPREGGPSDEIVDSGAAYVFTVSSQSTAPVVTFTGGPDYTPPPSTPGMLAQPVARASVITDQLGASGLSATVSLVGTNTGVASLGMWASADSVFDFEDVPLSTETLNPATPTPASVNFTSLPFSILTTPVYLFLTADLTAGASGTLQASIAQKEDVQLTVGTLSNPETDFPMSLSSGPVAIGNQPARPFITTWQTTSANETIQIPTGGSSIGYDFVIDWGDGTIESYAGSDPDPSHRYEEAGTYTVSITGSFARLRNEVPNPKLQSIEQWGTIRWESMAWAFRGFENLVLNATDAPDLTEVTSMNSMFYGASSFNGDIGGWDVSNVVDMSWMFREASSFNQDIGGWNVSGVIDMVLMFSGATSFNGNIGEWNVSNVVDMSSMFSGASSFNQNIGDWDVSSVSDMRFMFRDAASFNQPIGT